jgi:flagellar hook assembly protein FlgD
VLLGQVFPNPTPAGATVAFGLPAGAGPGEVTIVNAAGRLVRRLAVEEGAGGRGSLVWDGRDELGHLAPTGVYFIRLSAGGASAHGRLVVFRDLLEP